MKKVLITGASGYLGSTFLKYLPQDWETLAFDLKEPKAALPSAAKFVKGSINDKLFLSRILEGVDLILHFAAIKGSDNCCMNPMNTIEVNICGTHNLIKSALLKKVKKLIFLSSYWVYGENTELPFKEDAMPSPRELYGLSKAVSEQELILSGIDYVILRCSNIFGFGCSGNEEVVFNFIRSAFQNKPLKLISGGKQKLDIINVDDAWKCIQRIASDEGISRCVLNIGSGIPTSILELAQIVSMIFKKKYNISVSIETVGPVGAINSDRWVSLDKFKSKIGKLRFKTLEESIESYARQYKERIYDKGCKAVL